MKVTRDDQKWFAAGLGLGWLLIVALFVWMFSSSCTSTQRQTFRSHAAETGIAAGGGALAVLVGGTAAIPIFVLGMGTAAFVGEVERPPPQTEHTTTVLDPNGKIISQKTTVSESRKAPTAMESILSWLTTKTLIVLGLLVLALLFPATRGMAVQALSGLASAARAAPGWIGAHLKSLRTQKRPERRKPPQWIDPSAP